LDPNLINQTKNQLTAKKSGISFYQNKINSTQSQIANLYQSKKLKIAQLNNKLNQLNNKLAAERAELSANENEMKLVKNQFDRQLKMFEDGLVSQTQLQQRNIQYQNTTAKTIATENKIAQTQQEIINTRIEQNSVEQEYSEKINKTEGDRFQSLSQIANSQGEIAKLENQINNYTIRNGMYIITAPQDGQIVQANKFGIGEIVKDGESICVIVPNRIDYAVEIFVKPMDINCRWTICSFCI
jgi:multidrug resistance efflux pump